MNNTTILVRALRYGTILTIGILVVGGLIGYLIAGIPGLVSALLGAGVTAVFMGLTGTSFVVASRVAKLPEGIALYYGIVLGTFVIKFVVFLVLLIALRGATWLNPTIFGITILAAVLGTLVVDTLAVARGRVPYTDVALPGEKSVDEPAEKPGSPEKSASES